MNIKKQLRLVALIVFIAIACAIPFPMTFKRKDNLPKHLIEQLDTKDDAQDENLKKDAFG
ncbi:hypothetical protein [uncultured Lacinutrix sp.]|uniref:hypothetical protein n=1 Tax=uncultured Lacinutrix sp. TaxID=574032 RepID=UPI0026219C33|nr:hypothetical protein [uncultured Lacinutrix sp.]